MKTFFVLLVVALVAFSCEKDDTKPSFVIDPDAKVRIECESTNLKAESTEHLTALEVVKQSTFMMFYNDISFGAGTYGLAMWPGKDTVSETPAFLRLASDIIYDTTGYGDWGLQNDFIYAYDIVICKGTNQIVGMGPTGELRDRDTIAYIANNTIAEARQAILVALSNNDTASVYNIFNNAFKFAPITGAEWRVLKAQGLN